MADAREILRQDIETMALLDELAERAVSDAHGLTLGDIAGHRLDRYLTHWRVLQLVAELGRRGLLRASDVLRPIGAEVQDKTGVDAFQAAHVLACDFEVNAGDGMHTLFVSPIIRGNVKVHLFGRTNVVHKLVNYADRRCEANGWIDGFAEAVAACLAPGADAHRVYAQVLVPRFAAALAQAQDRLEAALSAAERRHLGSQGLVAPGGAMVRQRPQDFRVSAKLDDPRVRALNKAAVLQVFAEYRLGPAGLAPSTLAAAREEAIGWVELERQWRARWS